MPDSRQRYGRIVGCTIPERRDERTMTPANPLHKQRSSFQRRLRILARHPMMLSFYVPALMVAIANGLLSPILPLFIKDLGGSYVGIGLVLAAPLLGTLIGDIPGGVLLRRWGHRQAMVLGLLLTVSMTFTCFWAKSIGMAFVLQLISGFGTALYAVARHTFVTDMVSIGSRGRAISAFGGMMRIGKFIGPMFGGTLGATYGLRLPFLVYGVIGGIAVVTVLLAAVTAPAIKHNVNPNPKHRISLLSVVRPRIKLLIPAGVGQLFAQMIRSGRTAIIPLYAADVVGLDVGAIGWLLGIGAFVEMTLFYPAGWIMDHVGRKAAIVPSFLIQAVAMACVPLSSTFTTLLLCVMAIGAGNGLSSGAMMTLGSDLSPSKGRGEFLGVWRLIGDIGSSGGPNLVGTVADALALPSAAIVLAVAGLISAAVFGFLLPETLVKEKQVNLAVQTSP
ncbi:MAG: MFS transporter [Anaerolineales bacterium]|nr:MAG: MFS transporter [Anaerolineales bacterium]